MQDNITPSAIIETQHDESAWVAECATQLRQAMTARKLAREMLSDYLEGSSDYKNATQAIELNQQAKRLAKNQLLNHPAGAKLHEKLDELNTECRELKETLSAALEVYWNKKGTSEIKAPNGVVKYKKQFAIPAAQLNLF